MSNTSLTNPFPFPPLWMSVCRSHSEEDREKQDNWHGEEERKESGKSKLLEEEEEDEEEGTSGNAGWDE